MDVRVGSRRMYLEGFDLGGKETSSAVLKQGGP